MIANRAQFDNKTKYKVDANCYVLFKPEEHRKTTSLFEPSEQQPAGNNFSIGEQGKISHSLLIKISQVS